jgi:toxin ParE1/3/4
MAQNEFFLYAAAEADIETIAQYLTAEAGPRVARRNILRILRKLTVLAAYPGIGRSRPDLPYAPLSFAIPPWLVIYEAQPDGGIAVWRILHGRRDLPHLVRRPE